MALLIEEPAVFVRPSGTVRVTGPDRVGYLHTLLSQHLESAGPGSALDFLYLDAKGSALAAGRAIVRDDDVLLITPSPGLAADLAAALEKFKFLLQVEAVDCTEDWQLASVRGRGPIESAGAPSEPMTAALGDGLVVRDRSGGVDLIGPRPWLDERIAQLKLPEASAADWEAWRILAGEPGWDTEISSGRRAQELGLLPTHVHLRKGCYPGQESIAKIYNLGRPRRALAIVELDGPIAAGDPLDAGGKAGEVTSAAEAGGSWVALALLPLDSGGDVLGGGEVRSGDVTARVLRRVGEGVAQPGA